MLVTSCLVDQLYNKQQSNLLKGELLFSPPENDSFRKDLCFSPDVFFSPDARSPRCVGRPACNFAQWSILGQIL